MHNLFEATSIHRMTKKICTQFIFLHSIFFISSVSATELDWFPREALTQKQQASVNQYCQGAYIDQWQASDTSNTKVFADLIIRTNDGKMRLQGGAEILQPEQSLKADQIDGELNKHYQLSGNVVSRGKDQLILASNAEMSDSVSGSEVEFEDATFLFHKSKIRGEANNIQKTKNGVIFIKEGFYTTCEPGSISWQMFGSSIELDSNTGFGTAKHVQIRISGVPVFYFPWMRFPLDSRRQTGFLFPTFGYSSDDGVNLSTPIYLNIAPQLDATLTPHFIEHQGEGFDLEMRYLNERGLTTYEESTFIQDEENQQTLRKLESTQTFGTSLSAYLLFEDNPTENKIPEVSTISLGEEDNYERSAKLSYQKNSFATSIAIKRYQTPLSSNNKPFEWAPRIESSYNYDNDWLSYKPKFQFTDYEDPDGSDVDGQRSVINQDINFEKSNQWGFITPGVLHQYRSYDLHSYSSDSDYTASVNHLTYYLDSGISFERTLDINSQRWRQTLEPKFSYLNAPFKDQSDIPDFDTSEKSLTYSQAFSHTRFSGNDWIGDTEQITLGVESRVYDQNNNERWAFKLGQIYYLADRRIDIDDGSDNDDDDSTYYSNVDTSSESPILTELNYQHNELFNASLSLNYDIKEDDLELGKVSTSYSPSNGVRFNASYLYKIDDDTRAIDTKQTSFSTIVPIDQNWTLMYQEDYDLVDDVRSKKVAGIGFENCCVKAQFNYQHWRDDDENFQKGLYLKFILRSLSTIGKDNETSSISDTYWNSGKIGYE
ncbi:organic solvent tolerance protein OstA precursor [Marinomonas sp. MED121]|uniref:LPS-assembly protein LptD n=1 Tax=Marinomonas sp. MED121 TaxID=314277 RepID=UPI000069031C|nr:LPS assembly protein LptD [Marinomonas sp. MED121]EAQ66509.1 organic solvent tolerance protein OstA precursor [Marinomonas sp. MED121]